MMISTMKDIKSYTSKLLKDTGNYLKSKKFFFSAAGFLLLLAIWQIGTLTMHEIMIASPADTFSALGEMIARPGFWKASFITAERMFYGIILGGLVGLVLGVIAGLNENIQNLLEPIRWMIMSISPVIVVGIAMIWFGMGTQMVVWIAAFLLSPIVYVNTIKGISMVDHKLIEMAEVYKFSLVNKLVHIYIPALIGPLSAAMTIVISAAMRMIVLAEVLGTNSGIGYEFAFTKTDMNTGEMYGWVLVSLFFVGFTEYIVFKPLENYFLRWKN